MHPCRKVLVTYLGYKHSGGYFDIIASLEHVDSIVHVKVTLAIHWDGKFFVNLIQEDICCDFVRCRNGKIVNLMFEYYAGAIDLTRV